MAQKSEIALNSGNCIGGVEIQAEMSIANWINISEAHEQDRSIENKVPFPYGSSP